MWKTLHTFHNLHSGKSFQHRFPHLKVVEFVETPLIYKENKGKNVESLICLLFVLKIYQHPC